MTERRTPANAVEFQRQLESIFPAFTAGVPEREEAQEDMRVPVTFHAVMHDFVPFFSGRLASWSEPQLRRLAALLNAAVDQGGELENAVSTCMLEHLHQVRCDRALRPFLSPAARDRMRA